MDDAEPVSGAFTRSVAAIVVHYRTPQETVRAAQAAAPQADELLVVDNDSRDGIEEELSETVPSARLMTLPQNLGYGAACNRGAAATDAAYLLFLNSDAYVQPGTVATLVGALERDAGVAAVGPLLRDPTGAVAPSIQRYPTLWRIVCESLGLAALAGGRGPLRGHTKTRESLTRSQAVETLKGAALLVRRRAFEQVGGFDEAFFLYAEETDLLRRMTRSGWRVLFEPSAEVVHLGGASAGDRLFGSLHRSLVRYVRKHQGAVAADGARLALFIGAALRYLFALLTPGERGRTRRIRYRAALGHTPGDRGAK